MNSKTFLKSGIFLILLLTFIAPAVGDTDVRPTVAVSYEIDPVTFFPDDFNKRIAIDFSSRGLQPHY